MVHANGSTCPRCGFSVTTMIADHSPGALASYWNSIPKGPIIDIIRRAMDEDIGHGDITTALCVPEGTKVRGVIYSHADGIVCGLPVAALCFAGVDPGLMWNPLLADGDHIGPRQEIGFVEGSAAAILAAERVGLNLLQRMTGIATATAEYVSAVSHTAAAIVDTRKTVPGLRILDKYAVRCGGGGNHRFGLFDGILIKDNHIEAAGSVGLAVDAAKRNRPHTLRIEVEVDRLDQIEEAIEAGGDILLLDNMDPFLLREAVRMVAGRAETEASGGIDLNTVKDVAEAGVDYISVGRLTHSVTALDIGLDLDRR